MTVMEVQGPPRGLPVTQCPLCPGTVVDARSMRQHGICCPDSCLDRSLAHFADENVGGRSDHVVCCGARSGDGVGLAPGCSPPGTGGPLRDSVALPGTLAGLAVLTVGVHAGRSRPPSCVWGAQGLVWGGRWEPPLSYSWREAGGAYHRKPSLMPVPRQRPPSCHVPDQLGPLGSWRGL